MTTVGAREANRSFSKILKEAENGQTVTITRNGKAIAQIGPAQSEKERQTREKALAEFLAFLEKGFDLGGKGFTRDEMHER